jgi:hypothetical protein
VCRVSGEQAGTCFSRCHHLVVTLFRLWCLCFPEAIKGNPDLWLVPVFLLTNTTTPPLGPDTPGLGSSLGTSITPTRGERSEMGLRSSLLPPRFQPAPPPPRPAPEVAESEGEEEVWRLQCLRAGVDRFLPRCASTFGQLHSVLLGRGAVRRRLERMVSSMQVRVGYARGYGCESTHIVTREGLRAPGRCLTRLVALT